MSSAIVIRGDKVQAWADKDCVVHVVLFMQPPNRLACFEFPMHGYRPQLAFIKDIDCADCRKVLESST